MIHKLFFSGLLQGYIYSKIMKQCLEPENSIDNSSLSAQQLSPSKQITAHDVCKNNKQNHKKKKSPYTDIVANLVDTKYNVVKKVIKNMLGLKIIRDPTTENWDIFWTDNAVTPEQLGKMKQHQKINHFPGMFTLSRKNYLARNLTKMEKKFPQEYNFFPITWVLPSQLNELRKFMESDNNAVVIAKPEASSQGKGIFLTKNIEDFQFGEHYVVQKYLKKPFIVDGLKFDFRVYVLVAGCDPLRVYIYNEGLARFATDPYVLPKKQNIKNLYMHLTNYAINKNSEKFQFNNSKKQMDKGHKRSLSSVMKKIQEMGNDRQKIWDNIKDCIAKTLISGKPILAHHYRSCQPENFANNMCFQILGFDVILDHRLNPEILEVNYTPSFATDTPLDLEIKKNLIADSLILMNVTNKAKTQVISEKKKQIQERTLTGKKFYHSKQSRQQLINKLQSLRDQFQTKNIGNFERILPLNLGEAKNIEKNNKYLEFQQYSEQCYLQTTGANIRRNIKVIPTSQKPNLISQNSQTRMGDVFEENNEVAQQIYNQPQKFTNTENLQKIYKSKFRPMLLKKGVRNHNGGMMKANKKQSQGLQSSKLLNKKTSEQRQGDQQEKSEETISFNTITKFPSPYNVATKAQPNKLVMERAESYKKQWVNRISREVDRKQTRNAVSMKRGLSTVYNITFEQNQQMGAHSHIKYQGQRRNQ